MQNDLPTPGTTELTEREQEILRLVATGTSNKDIAQQLFISSNTVKVHLRNIFAKIGVASRTEAAVYAIHAGISQAADLARVESASLESSDTIIPPVETKRKKIVLWVSVAAAMILLGVFVTFGIIRYRSSQIASASPTPVVISSRWQELAELPTARSGLAVAVYENQIYAIGGETGTEVTGLTEQYNVTTNTWLTLPSKPVPVADINAAVIGGKIYIPGGRLTTGEMTDVLESYDPKLNLWEKHTPLPVALSGYALVAFEGKLYVFGGWDGKNTLAFVYEYYPDLNTWQERTAMSTARAFAGAAGAGGKIYVLGGFDGEKALGINEEYLPDGDTWVERTPLPAVRYAMGATSIADLIYIVGGIGKPDSVLPPLQYSSQQDQWQTLENSPSRSWSFLGLVPLQTHIYGMGGEWDGMPSSHILTYQAIYTITIPLVK
jgi:DNA-binding CsgD family transcriptional regulator